MGTRWLGRLEEEGGRWRGLVDPKNMFQGTAVLYSAVGLSSLCAGEAPSGVGCKALNSIILG